MFNEYFELQQKIFDYFSYVEDWKVIPLVDHREYYWTLKGQDDDGEVVYYEKPITASVLLSEEYYAASIYTQRFLPKWVYRADDYTLICMDTHTDGNKFLGVFDNSREIKFE